MSIVRKTAMARKPMARQTSAISQIALFIAAMILPLNALPAMAQNASYGSREESILDPVVVSATRTENTLDKTPASVSVVTREGFEDVQADSVSDAMKLLPNVNFGGSPRMDGEIPAIRGYTGKSISIMVDGARRNDATAALRTPLYIDPYFISRAEVLRGSSSSLYGPGGVGGAMSFRTIAASDMLADGQSFGGSARYGYADADTSKHANVSVYGQGAMFDGLVAAGYHETSKIKQGEGSYLSPNDGTATTGLAKAGMRLGQIGKLELSHQIYQQDKVMPVNPQADVLLPNAPGVSGNHAKQAETVLKFASEGDALKANVYQSSLEVPWDQGATAAVANQTTKTDTTGGSLQNTSRFNFAGDHRITFGVDYYKDKQTATSKGVPNPVLPDGTQEVYGFFAEDEIGLGQSLRLIPSVRYDNYSTSPDNVSTPSKSSNRVSPKVTLSWQAAKPLSFYGSYGEAFRVPTLIEYYSNISGTNYFMNFQPNPDLKPETDKTYEIGVIAGGNGVIANGDNLRVRLSAFDGTANDMISSAVVGSFTRTAPFKGTGFILQSQNIATAKRRGGELEANYSISAVKLGLSYSTVRVTDNSTGAGLYSPPDKYVGNIRYLIEPTGVSATWNTTVVAGQEYDSTELRRRPGYTAHDMFISWEAVKNSVRLDLGVENIFDKRYSVYQSSMAYAYTYEAGRNVKAALNMSF